MAQAAHPHLYLQTPSATMTSRTRQRHTARALSTRLAAGTHGGTASPATKRICVRRARGGGSDCVTWRSMRMASAGTLNSWGSRTDYLTHSPPWAARGSRGGAPSPSVQLDSGEWAIYFQANPLRCETSPCGCIGSAHAHNAGGPFTPSSQPVICMPAEVRCLLAAGAGSWLRGCSCRCCILLLDAATVATYPE